MVICDHQRFSPRTIERRNRQSYTDIYIYIYSLNPDYSDRLSSDRSIHPLHPPTNILFLFPPPPELRPTGGRPIKHVPARPELRYCALAPWLISNIIIIITVTSRNPTRQPSPPPPPLTPPPPPTPWTHPPRPGNADPAHRPYPSNSPRCRSRASSAGQSQRTGRR